MQPESVLPFNNGWAWHRLRSEAELDEVGKALRLCVRDGTPYAAPYRRQFRDGELGFFALKDGEDAWRMLLSYDTASGEVEEVRGDENRRPVECRWAIVWLIKEKTLKVADWRGDLGALGIAEGFLEPDPMPDVAIPCQGGTRLGLFRRPGLLVARHGVRRPRWLVLSAVGTAAKDDLTVEEMALLLAPVAGHPRTSSPPRARTRRR